MTVGQNVAYGLNSKGVPKTVSKGLVAEALDKVGLGHLIGRRPKDLSGGQQQRVALARALVIQPSVLLLDEPLSNLDAKLRESMRGEIRRLQLEFGITTVFVTHDQDEALAVADKVAVLDAGRVQQFGSPREIYDHPQNEMVARFMGRGNFFSGHIVRKPGPAEVIVHLEELGMEVPVALADFQRSQALSGQVKILARPHLIRFATSDESPDATTVSGTLLHRTYTGDSIDYNIDVNGTVIRVEKHTPDTLHAADGDAVKMCFSPSSFQIISK